MATLDTRRNADLFSAREFRETGGEILVVGLGMLGSHIAELLARLGLDLRLCDHDRVEPHNLSNQAMGLEDVGLYKVEAMKRRLERDCGIHVQALSFAFVPSLLPARVMFVAPDSNDVRKSIWLDAKQRLGVELYIEVRTGPTEGRIYCLDPWDSVQAEQYEDEKILYPDSRAVDFAAGACQSKTSVAFTGYAIAALAVAQFVRWTRIQKGLEEDVLDNEIIHTLWPPSTYARRFV